MTGRLPLTVISGYLGAGKTTLINRLLAEAHGQKLMVMVNDFGAINIDAELLASATEDTLTLTNGCVCCTMGADLFMAIGDVLDRADRPDHLVIEASGIADPARIAQVALAEPDLSYGGIITVVDALQFEALSKDNQIGAQIEAQVRAADLVALSKAALPDARLVLQLSVLSGAEVVDLAQLPELAPLVLGQRGTTVPEARDIHPAYVAWQSTGDISADRATLEAHLRRRPEGLFRFKGFVSHDDVSCWEVHVVGAAIDIKPLASRHASQVVGIGLASRISAEEIEAWWSGL
jgi:G3E family GTPase